MKKTNIFLLVAASLIAAGSIMTSCAGGNKVSPQEEVRAYGKYFVEKLSANQLDSIKSTYPDIAKADSVAPIQSDTIIVVENEPGQFDLTLAEGITMKLNRSEEGNISVTETKGLFIFPSDRKELAEKTGMWADNLSDAQLADRLADNQFFDWLKKSKTVNSSDIIALGQTVGDGYYTEGYRYVVNKTDQPINASDYVVIRKYSYSVFNGDGYDESSGSEVLPGKNIPPHGSVKFGFGSSSHGGEQISGVKLKLTPEQLQERFAPYTGTEYQDYLNSKK